MKVFKPLLLAFFLFPGLTIHLNAYRPIRMLTNRPTTWNVNNDFTSGKPRYNSTKKSVFIIADHESREIFNMLSQFYFFNPTGTANAEVVSEDDTPILIKKDLFVRPQLTFPEADALYVQPDVMVIAALNPDPI